MSFQSGEAKRFLTPTRVFFTVIVLSSIALFVFACNSRETTNAPANTANTNKGNSPAGTVKGPPDTSKLTAVPDDAMSADLKDVDGKPLKISEYNGKVLIINLWATWCGPCRIETPEMVQISKEYKDRGVEVLGLTTQNNDPDIGAIKDFLREQNVPYRTIYDDGTLARSLSDATNAKPYIPQSYLITRDGKILTHFEGFDPRSTPNKMRQYIELALTYKT
jgi:thiol-disulfide isomerase/thioredoxin